MVSDFEILPGGSARYLLRGSRPTSRRTSLTAHDSQGIAEEDGFFTTHALWVRIGWIPSSSGSSTLLDL